MGYINLNQIQLTPLKQITANGGDVFHVLKNNEVEYAGFGEAYFSWILPKKIKAWKKHSAMTMNLVVPYGLVKFVFFNKDNGFRSEQIGLDSYSRLTVPPGFWFGFQGLANHPSLILNLANIPHDPNEVERVNLDTFSYPWK